MARYLEHGSVYAMRMSDNSQTAWIACRAEDGRVGLVDDRGRFLREGIDAADFYFPADSDILHERLSGKPAVFKDGKPRTTEGLAEAGFSALESGRQFRALQRLLEPEQPRDLHFGCDHDSVPCQVDR